MNGMSKESLEDRVAKLERAMSGYLADNAISNTMAAISADLSTATGAVTSLSVGVSALQGQISVHSVNIADIWNRLGPLSREERK